MSVPLEACTREEQRAVIRFLGSEGKKRADIHRGMKRQYGDACVSLQQVYEWHRKFKSGGGGVSTDDEIKKAVHRWLRSQSEEFFSRGI
jgi:hypothetical protein